MKCKLWGWTLTYGRSFCWLCQAFISIHEPVLWPKKCVKFGTVMLVYEEHLYSHSVWHSTGQNFEFPNNGWEDLLEKHMASHSSILAWRTPWMEELGKLQFTGLHRVRRDWRALARHGKVIPASDLYRLFYTSQPSSTLTLDPSWKKRILQNSRESPSMTSSQFN